MEKIFQKLPNDLIIKILEHKRIEEQKDLNKILFSQVIDEINLNSNRMWKHYHEYRHKTLYNFLNEDYTSLWCFASIYNNKVYVDDSDDDY